MTMELETINKLFLELSQFATAKTARELALEGEIERLKEVNLNYMRIINRQNKANVELTTTPPADAALADRITPSLIIHYGQVQHENEKLREEIAALRARAVPDEPVESILAAYKTGISHGKEQTNHEFEFAPGSASDKAYATGYNEGYEQRLAMLTASKGAKQ